MKTTVSGCYEEDGGTYRCDDKDAEFWSVYTSADDTPQMWHSDHNSRTEADAEAARLTQ